jgi:hypothetical protein
VEHEEATAVAEQRLHLDAADELRHAVEHVARAQRRVAARLDLVVGQAVTRRLAELVADEGDGLGLAEP